jgi:hypothetical protein
LTVAGSTKNISLSGHTHDYSSIYAAKSHSHDIYREKTDNLFIDGIILKKGELQTAISIDDAGNIYVSGNFYATGSVSAGGPWKAPPGAIVCSRRDQRPIRLLKVRNDTGKLVALISHTHTMRLQRIAHMVRYFECANVIAALDVHPGPSRNKAFLCNPRRRSCFRTQSHTSYSKPFFVEEANGGTQTLYNGALHCQQLRTTPITAGLHNVSRPTATKLTRNIAAPFQRR